MADKEEEKKKEKVKHGKTAGDPVVQLIEE
jgi:hypothetical protein